MLEINCGEGEFLPLLWQCGFDVAATEPDPRKREKAAAQPAPGLEIYAAADDHLPFDDGYFDWVLLHLRRGAPDGEKLAVAEGLRVAKRGLMVAFWNSASLNSLVGVARRRPTGDFPWYRVWRLLRAPRAGSTTTYTTFYPCPAFARGLLSLLGNFALLKIFGSWCLIRLDLSPPAPLTPIALKLGANMPPAAPTLEFSHKNITSDKKL